MSANFMPELHGNLFIGYLDAVGFLARERFEYGGEFVGVFLLGALFVLGHVVDFKLHPGNAQVCGANGLDDLFEFSLAQ